MDWGWEDFASSPVIPRLRSPINKNPVIPDFYSISKSRYVLDMQESDYASYYQSRFRGALDATSPGPTNTYRELGPEIQQAHSSATTNYYTNNTSGFIPPGNSSGMQIAESLTPRGAHNLYAPRNATYSFQGGLGTVDPRFLNQAQPNSMYYPEMTRDNNPYYAPPQTSSSHASVDFDSDSDDPVIDDVPHIRRCLGIWPGRWKPAVHWDLTKPDTITRDGVSLVQEELHTCPFKPPVSSIRITFEHAPAIPCIITAQSGSYGVITLQYLIDSIAAHLRMPLTMTFWRLAPKEIRESTVRAWGVRHPGEPAPWGLNRFSVMEAWETYPGSGLTGFLNMDALGPNVIFLGFDLGPNFQEWNMKTIERPFTFKK